MVGGEADGHADVRFAYGSAKDGRVTAFIPDPDEKATGPSAAEGVAVDRQGNIYGAEVGPRGVKKYVRQ